MKCFFFFPWIFPLIFLHKISKFPHNIVKNVLVRDLTIDIAYTRQNINCEFPLGRSNADPLIRHVANKHKCQLVWTQIHISYLFMTVADYFLLLHQFSWIIFAVANFCEVRGNEFCICFVEFIWYSVVCMKTGDRQFPPPSPHSAAAAANNNRTEMLDYNIFNSHNQTRRRKEKL